MTYLLYPHLFYTSILILLFSGCSKQPLNNKIEQTKNFNLIAQQAKFVDLPTPINSMPLSHELSDKNSDSFYAYSIVEEQENLAKFYDIEMEKFGWNKITQFMNNETLLIYEKPNLFAYISIRPLKNKINQLNVFIAQAIKETII